MALEGVRVQHEPSAAIYTWEGPGTSCKGTGALYTTQEGLEV